MHILLEARRLLGLLLRLLHRLRLPLCGFGRARHRAGRGSLGRGGWAVNCRRWHRLCRLSAVRLWGYSGSCGGLRRRRCGRPRPGGALGRCQASLCRSASRLSSRCSAVLCHGSHRPCRWHAGVPLRLFSLKAGHRLWQLSIGRGLHAVLRQPGALDERLVAESHLWRHGECRTTRFSTQHSIAQKRCAP